MRLPLIAAGLLSAVVLVPATAGAGTQDVAHSAARAPQKKTVKIGDNFYAPTKLTVNRNSTITWKWPSEIGDSHDVALDRGPKGFKTFESDIAGSSFSYKKKLTKPGTYKIYCTLHEEMTMTIKVRS